MSKYHILLDRFLLSIGALSYGGVVALAIVQIFGYVEATAIFLPLLVLTGLGIATTVGGLKARGQNRFHGPDSLIGSGTVLGILGFFGWIWNSFDYGHVADVCNYSKSVSYDASAKWACPQLAASYNIMWTLAVGLLIPSLLYLAGLYLFIGQRKSKPRSEPKSVRRVGHE